MKINHIVFSFILWVLYVSAYNEQSFIGELTNQAKVLKEKALYRNPIQEIIYQFFQMRLRYVRKNPNKWYILIHPMPDPCDIAQICSVDQIIKKYMNPDDPIIVEIEEIVQKHQATQKSP